MYGKSVIMVLLMIVLLVFVFSTVFGHQNKENQLSSENFDNLTFTNLKVIALAHSEDI